MKEFHTVEHNTVQCSDVKFHKKMLFNGHKDTNGSDKITIYKLINLSLAITNYYNGWGSAIEEIGVRFSAFIRECTFLGYSNCDTKNS